MARAKPSQNPQDKEAGLVAEREGGRFVTTYNPHVAMRVVERVAEGELLVDICAAGQGMPHRSTFHRWVVQYPELARAYGAARELSAIAFEEEALLSARKIKLDPESGTKVRAYEVAMNQFRWSAARRDPARFGDKATVNVRVPVQIITPLNLGPQSLGGGANETYPNIYEITAVVTDTPQDAIERAAAGSEPFSPPKDPPLQPKGPLKRVLIPRKPTKRVPFGRLARGELDEIVVEADEIDEADSK